jgi:hypothetical protein
VRSTRRPAGFANYAATVLVDWTPFDGRTSRRRSRADQPDVVLIEAEEAVLRRLAGLRSVRRQANHVNQAHFDRHRGAYLSRYRSPAGGIEQELYENSWLILRLGLDRYPIEIIPPQRIPRRNCVLCRSPEWGTILRPSPLGGVPPRFTGGSSGGA